MLTTSCWASFRNSSKRRKTDSTASLVVFPSAHKKGPRSGTGNIGGLGLAMDGRVGQRLPSRAEYLSVVNR
jgi:hypothetical protein